MSAVLTGRLTKAAIHCDAGELEVRLSPAGNWQLHLRCEAERDWRLACSGDLRAGAPVSQAPPGDYPITLGSLRVDSASRRAWVDGVELTLGNLEFDLLSRLASDPTRVFTKEHLLNEIWGCKLIGKARLLDTRVSRLRVKLRKAGASGLVVNVWGVGYRLWSEAQAA